MTVCIAAVHGVKSKRLLLLNDAGRGGGGRGNTIALQASSGMRARAKSWPEGVHPVDSSADATRRAGPTASLANMRMPLATSMNASF